MTPPPSVSSPHPPPLLGRFEIVKELARGSQGVTYLARDTDSGEAVAISEYRPAGPTAERSAGAAAGAQADADGEAGLALFRLVGEVLAAIRHPNVLRVRDVREEGGRVYLIADHLEGRTLETLLARDGRPFSEPALTTLLTGLLEGIEEIHTSGLLHRDIKPDNIIVRTDGTPVLVDFGAAAPGDFPADAAATSLLTPGYAAPEQFLAGEKEGPWTDIHGLGAVAFRIVTGTAPPDARARLANDRVPTALRDARGRLSAALLAGIERALRLRPEERPQSAAEWRADLASLAVSHAEPLPAGSFASLADAATPPLARDDGDDECAPTVKIERARPAATLGVGNTPPLVAPGSEQRGRRRVAPWLLLIAVVALPALGWWGWQYYLANIKSEWVVDSWGKGDVRTIGEALARAKPGATITVRPGTYVESLAMTRPHHLVGDGDPADIVVVASQRQACLVVSADQGSVARLTLQGTSSRDDGLPCLDIAAGTLAAEALVIGNEGGPAVRIHGTATPVVRGSRITAKAASGIVIEGEAGGLVAENEVTGTGRSGMTVRDRARPRLAGNRLGTSGQAGILVSGDAAPELDGNVIAGSLLSGIEVRGRADPTVIGNRVEASGAAGIFVYEDGRGRFESNIVTGSRLSGFVVGAGGDPLVSGNRVEDNGEHGVLVVDDGKGRFTQNVIRANKGHGFALDLDAGPHLEENTVTENREPQTQRGRVSAP